MGVAWIRDIYQNNPSPFWIKSEDKKNNGVVRSDKGFSLDDRRWHKLDKGHYRADWFGIPWYYESEKNHYKIISLTGDEEQGVKIYHSQLNGQNYILFVDPSGKTIVRQSVNNRSDTNCKLVFPETGGFYIEPVNGGAADAETIKEETGEFIKSSLFIVSKVIYMAMTLV